MSVQVPLFRLPLHVGRPNIGSRQRFFELMNGVFDRAWLTNRGQLVQEFEARLSQYLGVRHCIAVSNGTVGLEIAIRALDLHGEVIIPSMTFVATAHALQWQGMTPVFCDIDPATFCIDPSEVERHITPRTTGIIGVHLFGRPCDTQALRAIASKHKLGLVYDAAHAFGCTSGGQMIGNFGDCEVFSFHATKVFNAFEGGAVVTNNDDLAERIRLMQNFGFAGMDEVIYVGTNGKMHEASAAMGITNLESVDEFVAVNKRNYECYRQGVSRISGLKIREYDETERNNYHYVIVEVTDDYPLQRDELMAELHRNNVLVRRYFWPGCHRMEPYRSYYPKAGHFLPHTVELCNRILAFPTGTQISEDEISVIVRFLASFQSTHRRRTR